MAPVSIASLPEVANVFGFVIVITSQVAEGLRPQGHGVDHPRVVLDNHPHVEGNSTS